MKEIKRYLITAALPYANGPLHIGHLAGAYLSPDIYTRFLRLQGKDVVFICGSDENGAAITMRAIKENTTPQAIVDKYHNLFEDTFKKIGVSFDHYHRTSSPLHHETSQGFFRNLYEKNEFIEKETEQYFDPEAQQFLADRYIKGTCPKCGFENAYGDQCENCGSSLSPTELINPSSTLSGAQPELRKTKHWYLPLDKYESWLKEWIETGVVDGEQLHYPEDWKNHVLGQCKSWIETGLQPRSMTRDLTWGVDVPHDISGAEGKKLYVWLDAPIGYISSTKQWAKDNDKNWESYWKDDSTALIHFIGKDNIVFHCIIFPAILKAHGEYILPMNVPANQFMNLEGEKISTSRNWAVWVHEYLEDIPHQEDALRYMMIKNMPEQKDSEFTWKGFQDANNNELVNNFANFVNRVVVLTNKYYEGVVPEFDEDLDIVGCDFEDEMSYHEGEMLRLFDSLDALSAKLRKFDFRGGLQKLMEMSSQGNQLLQFNAPWKTVKENPENVKVVMNLVLQYVNVMSIAVRPFLPFTSDKMRELLKLEPITENGEMLALSNALAEGELPLETGHKIGEPIHLFSRIDDDIIQKQVDKLRASKKTPEPAMAATTAVADKDFKDTINYDDFTKMDLRAATIIEASKVKKADKLLQLQIDLGFEKRTVVSGIAKDFKPEDIIGQRVTLLANLAPRKIRGVESQGMILMAENLDGRLNFVQPAKSAENGSKIS